MYTIFDPCQPHGTSWLQPKLSQLLKHYITYGQPSSQLQPITTKQLVPNDRLTQLPPEVVRIILQHLFTTSQNDLAKALQVSHTWAEIGEPLLWKDIVLTSKNINRFTYSLSQSTYNSRHIQSLTLKLQLNTSLERDLKDLVASLGDFLNLKTFSLSIESTDLRSDLVIQNLLNALPSSVASLEIGKLPARMVHQGLSQSPCLTIRHILPRLEHLRINHGQFCEEILSGREVQLPNLKTVLINDCGRSYLHDCPCKFRQSREWRSDIHGEGIALKARNLISAGCMPNLESFVVLTTSTTSSSLQTVTQNEGLDKSLQPSSTSLLRKDVLGNTTTLHPLSFAPFGQGIRVLRYSHLYAGDNVYGVGEIGDLKLVLEGNQTWNETQSGARFPPAFRRSRQGKLGNYSWLCTKQLRSSDLYNARTGHEGHLNKFDKDEKNLLDPTTYEGLERPV
ncbi:hypothetical protein H2198_000499 [Neophaeococcomyces mojaviensis]|uniref:Uncharacterized protein n=1 Tax=Neophaeococcomyces mojaviensis TaxID=3383035 RepID=A0ACC3AJN5_9EURO|nr:hypothetical protein H2198_000499 [Knufia sp. JES_112]